MDALESFKVADMTVKIYRDEDAESPREWDNLGTMVCWHRRYHLGDEITWKYITGRPHFGSPDEFREWLETSEGKGAIVLPLYLYDHSGITMSTGPFSCPWDSGQVGWIYATRETIRKEYSAKRITKKLRTKVVEVLQGEVKTYDEFLTGQVYGYVVEDAEGNDLDSCWGFFGMEYCKEEGRRAAEYTREQELKADKVMHL